MARRSGRNGTIMIDTSAGANGSATPISTVMTWTLNQSRDRTEVTCLGDTSRQYVAGLPDASGTFSGLLDLGVVNFKNLADGLPRSVYLYPDRTNHAGLYAFGTATFDMSVDGAVNDTVKVSINYSAASDFAWVGSY